MADKDQKQDGNSKLRTLAKTFEDKALARKKVAEEAAAEAKSKAEAKIEEKKESGIASGKEKATKRAESAKEEITKKAEAAKDSLRAKRNLIIPKVPETIDSSKIRAKDKVDSKIKVIKNLVKTQTPESAPQTGDGSESGDSETKDGDQNNSMSQVGIHTEGSAKQQVTAVTAFSFKSKWPE